MINKKINEFIEKAKLTDTFWVEKAKLDFATQLNKFRKLSEYSNKDLADKLGTSPAYISKVFRGESNLTIESMVKAARAANAELQINFIPNEALASKWLGRVIELQNHPYKPSAFIAHSTRTAAVVMAANDDETSQELMYG